MTAASLAVLAHAGLAHLSEHAVTDGAPRRRGKAGPVIEPARRIVGLGAYTSEIQVSRRNASYVCKLS